jgi:glycosyltransferase involved in cell wall biosynthesis
LKDEGTIGPIIKKMGIPVYTLNMNSGISALNAVFKLRRIVRSYDPDIIQGWMYHGNMAAYLAAKFSLGKPSIAWNIRHCLYDLTGEKRLTRLVINANRILSTGVDSIVYNSHVSKHQHEEYGFKQVKSVVVPNGFDINKYKPNEDIRSQVLKELEISNSTLIIGHIARFHPIKDHVLFIQSAVDVASVNKNVRFLLVGREVSLENPALVGTVPKDLIDRFIFTGERRDISRIMQALDVMVTSSRSEAFPNVIGEAMASGIPCVVTDVGDCKNIVGNTGIVVPPLNKQAMTHAILDMISKPVEERRALGLLARNRVIKKYSIESISHSYTRLYETLCPKI